MCSAMWLLAIVVAVPPIAVAEVDESLVLLQTRARVVSQVDAASNHNGDEPEGGYDYDYFDDTGHDEEEEAGEEAEKGEAEGGGMSTSVEKNLDVRYARQSSKQMADFYFPATPAPQGGWPSIIGLHGKGGTRKSLVYLVNGFVQRGLQFVPIDWRENSNAIFDVQHAATFLAENREDYNVGPIYLYGYSSGGHLAGKVLLTPNLQHFDAVVVAAGATKKQLNFLKENENVPDPEFTPTTLYIGCDDDPVYRFKFAKQLKQRLLRAGVLSYHTRYDDGCRHYPMRHYHYYDDIARFFKGPATYSEEGRKIRLGKWETISQSKACIKNNEGIAPQLTVFAYDVHTCQALCRSKEDCFAMDFLLSSDQEDFVGWENSKRKDCHLYAEACTEPLQKVKGVKGGAFKWIDQGMGTSEDLPDLQEHW